MRIIILLLTLLLNTIIVINTFAQEMPLVYEVENSGADYPAPYLPSLSELPSVQALPNPFLWADGRGSITNKSDWEYRRNEISAQIQNYEIGPKPLRPDTIEASYSSGTLTVKVTENGRVLTLTSQVILPQGDGPFPAVIAMNFSSIPTTVLSSRNIARITFSHDQVTTYNGGPKAADPYYKLYPNFNFDNTGQYSAWAWGVSRLIDGLELVKNTLPIDLKHLAVTGCSYAGKMALFAGAFDERVALTIAVESGGGGATSWRYSHSEPAGSVEKIDNTDYNWFMNSMKQFSGDKVSQHPVDHHELMAMCAPRALLVTGNPDFTWLSNPSCYVVSKACEKVYEALGISDRFGYSIIGGHGHCAIPEIQLPEVEAFIDKFLLDKDTVNTNVKTQPGYTMNLSTWIPWAAPQLLNGSSLYRWTSLVYPSNLQAGLDTDINFSWNKANNAEKYYIQLSLDPAFKDIAVSDSTTDTVKTIIGLLESNKYYWRVKVKSAAGLGPWSNVSSFITTLTIPPTPQLISSTSTSTGYITLNWNQVKGADLYFYQISKAQNFSSVLKSSATTDTTANISWFTEGSKYYSRVQAINIAGAGPWSNTKDLYLIYAPTELAAQLIVSQEAALTWKDNSSIEVGYIIERKLSSQSSFAVLDTLVGSGIEYLDKNVLLDQNYTYRVKAYKDSLGSAYSNDALLALVSVDERKGVPVEYSLSQNYPNPFNPETNINFALPKAALTKIIIYDLLGREVQILVNKELEAGYHEISFNAGGFQSGVYFYRIQSSDFIQTKKMVLMK